MEGTIYLRLVNSTEDNDDKKKKNFLNLPIRPTMELWLGITILCHFNLIREVSSYLALDIIDKNSGLSEILLERIVE